MSLKKLLKKYTPKELAESIVFPVKFSPREEKEAARQLAEARKRTQQQMTPEDRLVTRINQLRFQIEDYTKSSAYNPKQNFGSYLQAYLQILNIKNKEFAKTIDINETSLSQYINGHRKPGENIIMRLEIQSNKTIPAIAWHRLLQKAEEHRLLHDHKLRRRERNHVKSRLRIS